MSARLLEILYKYTGIVIFSRVCPTCLSYVFWQYELDVQETTDNLNFDPDSFGKYCLKYIPKRGLFFAVFLCLKYISYNGKKWKRRTWEIQVNSITNYVFLHKLEMGKYFTACTVFFHLNLFWSFAGFLYSYFI